MYAKVLCAAVCGIDGQIIEVETDVSGGLPQVNIVGLPDSAVRESTDRVRSAIRNCGHAFPQGRVTVNLAPADLRKEGSSFDLAIAVGILLAGGQWSAGQLDADLYIGELALDGSVRPVPGVLSMMLAARERGLASAAVPAGNADEARLVSGMRIIPVRHLKDVLPEHRVPGASAGSELAQDAVLPNADERGHPVPDFADVLGQEHAKRALTIAAAGMHNILLIGPPGSGKTMLMKRLPSILPPLTEREALEVMRIYSVSGLYEPGSGLWTRRPFRSPHHTVSYAGLLGGGSVPKPGEVSLAHRGVLFLDELPEFSRYVLDALRQPLEDRVVTIARARMTVRFPTHFLLAAAMNPCPCGFGGIASSGGVSRCTCTPMMVERYRRKLSGPLLDRIDLQAEVPAVDVEKWSGDRIRAPLTSATMREQVIRAQHIQRERYAKTGILFNGELSGSELARHAPLTKEAADLLKSAFRHLALSARAWERVLKMARTIADLEGSDPIDTRHAAEAVQYRVLDRAKREFFGTGER
jgi:magnesium chelatase family protein